MLLEHENTSATLRQRCRGSKTTDTRTDDDRIESMFIGAHANPLIMLQTAQQQFARPIGPDIYWNIGSGRGELSQLFLSVFSASYFHIKPQEKGPEAEELCTRYWGEILNSQLSAHQRTS
jgi:hypothetical protein